MGDVPTSNNAAAAELNATIRALVSITVAGAQMAAKAELPWLAWPVVDELFDYLTNEFGDLIYKELASSATFLVIDCQTAEEKNNLLESINNLKAAQAGGDADAHAKALQAAKDAFGKIIHSDGSASIN